MSDKTDRRFWVVVGNGPVFESRSTIHGDAAGARAAVMGGSYVDFEELDGDDWHEGDVYQDGELVLAGPACEAGRAGLVCGNMAVKTVDWMPPHLRASHAAAGNCGTWPHNGSVRLHLCEDCAAILGGDEDGGDL